MSASSAPARRIRRLRDRLVAGWCFVGVCLLMLVGIELGLRATFAVKDALSATPRDPRALADGYDDPTWAREYFAELDASHTVRWEPFVYWRRRPFAGQFIHVDERGLRRTWRPADQEREGPTVYLFGGSTLWGTGADDDGTIPSLLARRLAERGVAATCVNHGESGWVSMQSLVALTRELGAGGRPDLVIFYDGVNDTFSAYQQGRAGLTQNEFHRREDFERGGRLTPPDLALGRALAGVRRRVLTARAASAASAALPTDLDREVLRHHASVVDHVRALGRTYGFRSLFYWQPDVFSRADPSAYERGSINPDEAHARPFYEAVHARVRAGELPHVRDLGHVLDGVGPVLIDFCHLTERGNARVVDAMLDDVLAALASNVDSAGSAR